MIISLAAAGTALAFATPAAAQYFPQPQPYGNAYGYQNNFGQVRALQMRIDNIERQIRHLDRRDVIRDRGADRLRKEADRIENRLHRAARYGLNQYEATDIQVRVARLEQQVRYAVGSRGWNNGYGGYGQNGYGYNGYGQNGYYSDRDRDHDRDDGDHDGRWDRDDD
jgi:hypothetical protein